MDDTNDSDIHKVIEQSSNHEMKRNLLFESLKREEELRRALSEQQTRNDKLKLELEMERKKTVIKVESLSSLESERERVLDECSHANEEDLRDTFGTNSSILMQYKYDDLRESYSRCVKKLSKKSRQLKKVLQEAEFQRFLNIQLRDENIKLHEKIEQVCYRFLDLLDRRIEEKNFYKTHIDELQMRLMKYELVNSCKEQSASESELKNN
ncbi:hypothetical protein PVAND_009362 [Polypedilum vanderplanki]|uniref:Uncharacterized protein n=1 Tax=Polypedilum vanderplanki TaxID=319348 RepID=A0A9J6CDA6_POLVA|nr:hypothetical protein PVAND_009362 [Polypedilum vanderplanki]